MSRISMQVFGACLVVLIGCNGGGGLTVNLDSIGEIGQDLGAGVDLEHDLIHDATAEADLTDEAAPPEVWGPALENPAQLVTTTVIACRVGAWRPRTVGSARRNVRPNAPRGGNVSPPDPGLTASISAFRLSLPSAARATGTRNVASSPAAMSFAWTTGPAKAASVQGPVTSSSVREDTNASSGSSEMEPRRRCVSRMT